ESGCAGGTCLNKGCIPTTLLLNTAEFIKKLKYSSEFGIDLPSGYKINIDKIILRKNSVIEIHRKGIRQSFKSFKIDYIEGTASFIDNHSLSVILNETGNRHIITGNDIVIASGGIPFVPKEYKVDNKNIFITEQILELNEIPKKLAILGAGVTGCEFAYFYNELGCEVYLIELAEKILPINLDEDIHKIFVRELKKNKINVITGSKIISNEITDSGINLKFDNGNFLITDKLLLTLGRRGSSLNLNLDSLGIKTGEKGFIPVNDFYQTSVSNIFAIGDVAGKFLYAHTASAEGILVAEYIMGKREKNNFSNIPFTIFTYPEIGWAGLTEEEAVMKNIPIKKGVFHFRSSGRAHTLGEISGLVKLLIDSRTGYIIGAHIIGSRATDLIHTVTLAMTQNIKISELTELIAAHPSMTESLVEAANIIDEEI
ncbi:NAD(P)/FAD-dependent oxidoreductase, partial [Candidatus Dependentiae bacterium]|nr:NAD(P)/FAD-dependent oxidoreductase [Candidatus Dependentiae bacterium]